MESKLDLIKKREVEILEEFKKICDKDKIEYSLAFGTLLGSLRHKGFIPWDDDIDVIMTRKNYELFIKSSKRLPKYIFFQNKNTDNINFGYFLEAKLRDLNSKIEFDMNYKSGIFIDIFVIDGISSKRYNYKIQRKIHLLLNYISSFEKDKKMFNKKNVIIKSLFIMLYPVRILLRKLDISNYLWNRYINFLKRYKSNYFITYFGNDLTLNESDIYPIKRIKFENKEFSVFNNYKKFLETIYGDYMVLPPLEERVQLHINIERAVIKKTIHKP